jgi:hypothetical protein
VTPFPEAVLSPCLKNLVGFQMPRLPWSLNSALPAQFEKAWDYFILLVFLQLHLLVTTTTAVILAEYHNQHKGALLSVSHSSSLMSLCSVQQPLQLP